MGEMTHKGLALLPNRDRTNIHVKWRKASESVYGIHHAKRPEVVDLSSLSRYLFLGMTLCPTVRTVGMTIRKVRVVGGADLCICRSFWEFSPSS